MEKLFFFDETFYWGRSGQRATVIEAECELMQSVRPDELRVRCPYDRFRPRSLRAEGRKIQLSVPTAYPMLGISTLAMP